MYVQPSDLAERPGPTELAQVATPERDPIVAADLMDAVLRGSDTSAWQPADVDVANAALARINAAIANADATIDGYLGGRVTLPVDVTQFPIVTVWATAIVRYLLHKDRRSLATDDPIVRDYKDALQFLGLTRDGKFSLGANDPTPEGGLPQVQSKPAVFDRDCGVLPDFYGNL